MISNEKIWTVKFYNFSLGCLYIQGCLKNKKNNLKTYELK